MPTFSSEYWTDRLRRSLECYAEPLLREVAARLARVRSQWPAEELIRRCMATIANPAMVDRRVADLETSSRQLLALLGQSRCFDSGLGTLVEMAMALGAPDGLKPVLALLGEGLLYPELPEGSRLKGFEACLLSGGAGPQRFFTHPMIAARARAAETAWPTVPASDAPTSVVQEADGLEWPLRLAALWQFARGAPLRRTVSGEFFKRDHERLVQDTLLNRVPAEQFAEIPDLPFLTVGLALAEGMLLPVDSELRAAPSPFLTSHKEEGGAKPAASALEQLASLWASLSSLEGWDPLRGRRTAETAPGNPFLSACHLVMALLTRVPPGQWTQPEQIHGWLLEHHPAWRSASAGSWKQNWVSAFLLGVCYHLRVVQTALGADGVRQVRLSATGRWLLGLGEAPAPETTFPRTLLVQPNLEIIVYRQGLAPELISRLTTFAAWRTQGSACTLQLEPEAVYRSLEMGLGFDQIVGTLEQYGTRPTPPSVIEMLRTWSNKRERISVYANAAILEFSRPEDLEEALARGLPAVRLTDRLAAVANENAIDFRHFRLTGTRDYHLPQEKCVEVEDDGVTLNVDQVRSDLLLETELKRFAEPTDRTAPAGKKQYRLTPESLASARASGLSLPVLQTWFLQRAGQALPAAAEVLMGRTGENAPTLRQLLVLHIPDELVADGLFQWPPTRRLLGERLGPSAFAVPAEGVEELRAVLRGIGIELVHTEQEPRTE